MTDPATKTVATPTATQSAQVAGSAMARTLMAGTAAMRKARKTYLPKESAESEDAYTSRINRSTLFNAFGKTVDDMTGKVFTKPIAIKDNVPQQLRDFAEDIDLTGRHMNVFARDVFHDAMQTGVNYILTDMPPALPDGSTLADEQAAGNRPYLVHIPIERLLGWQSKVIGGVETLTQVRIFECVSEPDGEFDEKEIEQVRVLDAPATIGANCTWRTFRKAADGKWAQFQDGVTSLPKITLTAVYTNRTGFMTGKPPLEKLAELNVTHWQSDSDQRNILHVARVPILFWAGKKENDKLEISANAAVFSSDSAATLKYVEHTGSAIEAGRNDLKDLEFRMQTMGLQLLVDNPGQTATGEVRDDAKENSPLAMMARNLQDALEVSLGFMAEYLQLGDDAGGELEVNRDFGVNAMRGDLQQLVAARVAGDISRPTLWAEMQRRDYLSDSFDPKAEQALLDKEVETAPLLDSGPGRGMPLGTPPTGAP